MTSVNPGKTPISSPMTMPTSSIVRLSGVRQWTKPAASWLTISITGSPQARNREEDVGDTIEGRNAARQRHVGNAQEKDAAADRHHGAGAPDRTMGAVAADIHESGEKQECAENKTKHGHKHRIDAHQHDA